MRNPPVRRFLLVALDFSRSSPLLSRRNFSSSPKPGINAVSSGLYLALAGRGIIAKEVFYNLNSSELLQKGSRSVEGLSGVPVHLRGNVMGGTLEISKAQFRKLLKQVTSHISSVSTIFVQDGAVGSCWEFGAKVRIISDNPSAVSFLSLILWETNIRSISRDSCPLTVYVATSISPRTGDNIGLKSQMSNGFIAADIEHSSLILCGKAFADVKSVKNALSALAAPVFCARGCIPVYGRILVCGDYLILLFASDKTIQICSDLHKNLACSDAGLVLSPYGAAPFFHTGDSDLPFQMRNPTSVVFASSDCTGVLPLLTKISPNQAAYHFLAGYQDGKFVTTYCKDPSPIPPLELANALLSYINQNDLPCFLVNVSDRGKHLEGKDFLKTLQSTVYNDIPELSFGLSCDPKVGDLKQKYKKFLSCKYQYMPKEFSF